NGASNCGVGCPEERACTELHLWKAQGCRRRNRRNRRAGLVAGAYAERRPIATAAHDGRPNCPWSPGRTLAPRPFGLPIPQYVVPPSTRHGTATGALCSVALGAAALPLTMGPRSALRGTLVYFLKFSDFRPHSSVAPLGP